ncbi:hypothetical protein PR048_026217 [Dryococelus australis]|uniref:Uncharacterized protein n=1 Tax=Dryococelus australis TaxID=614101 RepID=A0ABQ9GKQ7_9NEOP|nr:hypothetical protein PR048_026217 [Dryococelus australis]
MESRADIDPIKCPLSRRQFENYSGEKAACTVSSDRTRQRNGLTGHQADRTPSVRSAHLSAGGSTNKEPYLSQPAVANQQRPARFALLFKVEVHAVRLEHCAPFQSLAFSVDVAVDARGSVALIATALLDLKRGKKLRVGGNLNPIGVKCGEHGTTPECNGGGNGRSPRKPADQRRRTARFPDAKIRGVTRLGIEPGSSWCEEMRNFETKKEDNKMADKNGSRKQDGRQLNVMVKVMNIKDGGIQYGGRIQLLWQSVSYKLLTNCWIPGEFASSMTFRLDSTVLCTNMPLSAARWLSAATVEGGDWASVLQEVSNTVWTNVYSYINAHYRGDDGQDTRDSVVLITLAILCLKRSKPCTKDGVDRARWLRTTNLRVPTYNCFSAYTSSKNGVRFRHVLHTAYHVKTSRPRRVGFSEMSQTHIVNVLQQVPRKITAGALCGYAADSEYSRNSVTPETLHALRVAAMRHWACVLVSPVSLSRFLTLEAGFPRGVHPTLNISSCEQFYSRFTVSCNFSEALLKFYFQDITTPRANNVLRVLTEAQLRRSGLRENHRILTKTEAKLRGPAARTRDINVHQPVRHYARSQGITQPIRERRALASKDSPRHLVSVLVCPMIRQRRVTSIAVRWELCAEGVRLGNVTAHILRTLVYTVIYEPADPRPRDLLNSIATGTTGP